MEITYHEIYRLISEMKKSRQNMDEGEIYKVLTELGINPVQYYLKTDLPEIDPKKLLMFKLKYGII
jgi:hypothetical protein